MGHQQVFTIGHCLHSEPAANIRRCDAHLIRRQPQMPRDILFRPPNTLPVQTKMQAVVFDLGIAAARFHRIDDDTVVRHLDGHNMGRRRDRRRDRGLITDPPTIGPIFRRFGMKRLTPRCEFKMHRQVINIQHRQFGRVPRLRQAIGHNHRHRFADMAHTIAGQHRAFRACALGSVDVGHKVTWQCHTHTRSL